MVTFFDDKRMLESFTLLYATGEGDRVLAETIAASWRQAFGLIVSLQDSDRTDGRWPPPPGPAAWIERNDGPYLDADGWLRVLYRSDSVLNVGGYAESAFDAAVDQGATFTDPLDRARAYRQAETILETPLFEHLRAALKGILDAEARGNAETRRNAEKAFATFTASVHALDQEFRGAEDRSMPDNLLAAVQRLPGLRRNYDRAALLAIADDIQERLKAQAARLEAMEGAALDGAETEALSGLFSAAGAQEVNIEPAAVGAHETVVGRWLSGRSG